MKAIQEILTQGAALEEAAKAAIFLHGRGGTAQKIISMADQLCGPEFHVVAPQARNNIWYLASFMSEEKLNEPILSYSVQDIRTLIEQIAEVISKKGIFFLSFSQGAWMSLEVTARDAERYGGIVAFTGSLIGSTIDESKYRGNYEGTKIWMSNGDEDPFIPLSRAQQSQEVVKKLGAQATLTIYEGRPHIVSDEEIAAIKQFIF